MINTNNSINIETLSSVWTPFTTSITGSITNPVTPVGATSSSYYIQMGKLLLITYSYQAGSGAGANNGNGAYRFNIPPGFTIDTTVCSPVGISAALGYANVFGSTNPGWAIATIFDSTTYAIFVYASANQNAGFLGASWFGIVRNYNSNLVVPIL